MENAKKIYDKTNERLHALNLAFFFDGWDSISAPTKAIMERSSQMATISELYYEFSTAPEYEKAVETLYQHRDALDEVLCHEITEKYKSIANLKKIPKEEYVAYQALLSELYPLYVECKQKGDFDTFEPKFDQIFNFVRKQAKWLETEDKKGYDVLLDEFEPGMTKKEYDEFFGCIREKLVPFIAKILSKKLDFNRDFTKKSYNIEGQKAYTSYIRNVMGFTEDRTIIGKSEHPFTTSNGRNDVRITIHYYENMLSSFIFSAIHEMGHGLYEMQVAEEIGRNNWGGASCAMHESQSRFMENMIARSYAFSETHFPKLKEIFPEELKDVTVDDWYAYVNEAQASFIRTEADELTYPLHVLIRYEIERAIVEDGLTAKEARALWNQKYFDYLGITVENDTDGILQDVHWSQGSIGYFPTYALGSAYAAQFYHAMEKDLNIDEAIKSGTVKEISKWNETHIHKYGTSKYPKEILKLATGEDFNPNYYIDYLIEKYTKLYQL